MTLRHGIYLKNIKPMDKKNYKFSNGLDCFQDELTLEQDMKITALFAKVNIQSITETKIIDLLGIITKENLILDFLKIILRSGQEISQENLMSLKNSELKEIIEDFFGLNPLVKQVLGIFRSAADIQTQNTMLSDSDQSAQDTTQDS